MRTVEQNCLQCNQLFDAPQKEVNRGNGKYCSLSCSSKARAARRSLEQCQPNVFCAQCSKHFYKNQSQQKNSKSGLFFCCRTCKDRAQKIGGIEAIQPPHYGTSTTGLSSTSRRIAFSNHPLLCNRCEYKEVVEVLQVHHKDRNRLNNEPDNLEVLCPTCHLVEHFNAQDGLWGWSRS